MVPTIHAYAHTSNNFHHRSNDYADCMSMITSIQAFTGDTLFVGSVGRPDLVGSLGQTAEDMAKMMYNTLQTKILTLPDDVQVRKGLTKMTFRWGRS